MKIYDIILINPNVVNSNMIYMETYVIFVIWELFGLYEDPLIKSSSLNNTDRHRQPLSLKDVGSPNHSFPMYSILGSSHGTFRLRCGKMSSTHLLGQQQQWSFPGASPSRAIFGSQSRGIHAICPSHSAWCFLIMSSSCILTKEPGWVGTSTFVTWSCHLIFSRGNSTSSQRLPVYESHLLWVSTSHMHNKWWGTQESVEVSI